MSYNTNLLNYSSASGNEIISKNFNNKTIVYKTEISHLIDEDFYRDGDNSSMEYTFEIELIIITNEYSIHSYLSEPIHISSYKLIDKFDTFDSKDIKYNNKSTIISLIELKKRLNHLLNENDFLFLKSLK
jgi:hypothetical protein